MRGNLTRTLARYQRTFSAFTTGQKMVAILGTGALLLAGFMVFNWAAKPSMAPLYSNLSGADTAAVVDELNAQGVSYELANNGSTVLVPRDAVYDTRIALSGEGLPANTGDSGGYSLLDEQDLSTSEFKEQTDFKRAMEGELARTIEGIDGVTTAVVHLAMPEKEVFSDAQDPTTSSVLVTGPPGSTLSPDQVQAIIHLVASSVDGLDPDQVTVADSTGTVLSAPSDSPVAVASSRTQQVETVQDQFRNEIQQKLDRLVGAGNSTVQVTASLDFDATTSESTTFEADPDLPPLSETTERETYDGADPGDAGGAEGVVGADGQTELDGAADAGGSYEKRSSTVDNAIPSTRTVTESAPGSIERLGIGILMDEQAAASVDLNELQDNVAAAVGLDRQRGDSIRVSVMPFDRTAEESAAEELAAAEEADAAAARMDLIRNAGLGLLVLAMIVLAWFKGRKRTKQRAEATTYVVEQLRADAQARAQVAAPSPAALTALEQGEDPDSEAMRQELTALVERQPEDVAALLRGWLVERP